MLNSFEITDDIFWVGFNDRRTELFENLWPLPDGVSYNSYLIKDQKCALMDTAHASMGDSLIASLGSLLDGRKLDYLIINHMEPDHSGSIGEVMSHYPDIQIVGNKRTFEILKAYFGDVANLKEIADGDTLSLGRHELQFHLTPWVHWPETMMTYETTKQILFSGDAFGMFGTLDGAVCDDQLTFDDRRQSEMRRYYSNIVAKYSSMVQKALAKLAPLAIKTICPLHGIVWRRDPAKVVGLYDKWSRFEADERAVVIVYGSMYGFTAQTADHIARLLAARGVTDIRVYDASKTHMSFLVNEFMRCTNVVLGSCAYNTRMLPTMEHLTEKLSFISFKHRRLAIFGGCSWSGGGVRSLKTWAEAHPDCFEMVCEPVEITGRPTVEKLTALESMVDAIVTAINK